MSFRLALFLCVFALHGTLAFSAPGDAVPADTPEDQQLLADIKALQQRLDATTPNAFGRQIPQIDNPRDIVQVVDDLETLLHKVKGRKLHSPAAAQRVVLTALEMLYRGRGNTAAPGAPKNGWFITNRTRGAATGLPEIEDILRRDLLDQDGKREFQIVLAAHKWDNNDKMAVGFPPDKPDRPAFVIGDEPTRQQILQWASYATAAPDYQTVAKPGVKPGETPKLLLTEELIDEAVEKSKDAKNPADRISADKAKAMKDFLAGFKKNLYDDSAKTFNDPNGQFVNYFGRKREKQEIVDALTRIEKGHLLLTGKAGVGKTTILQMLSDAFVKGENSVLDEPPPIMLEIPINLLTNEADPTAIEKTVSFARLMSKWLDRRIILYADEAHVATKMTQNALKAFLTEVNKPGSSRVHLVLSTTSGESRVFMEDKAFSGRFVELPVEEFNREDTIQLVQQAHMPRWKAIHKKKGYYFDSIDPEAFEFAYIYGGLEQPHRGNPTKTKELLEGAITRKLNKYAGTQTGPFKLTVEDIRDYIQGKLQVDLFPGDPNFQKKFDEKWQQFYEQFIGNAPFKDLMRQVLLQHFQQMKPDSMPAVAVFGPPGAGKSFGAKKLADTFFHGALLTINGAEHKTGGSALNKLIGSPRGHVGTENGAPSILTDFIVNNPRGGIIVIEEADYLHQDVIQLLTNMITDKKFTDGMGREWDTSRFIIVANSNRGQELMIPPDSRNQMNWEQYQMRRRNITQDVVNSEGKKSEQIKPEVLDRIFDNFIHTIVTKSNPGEDTSEVSQEAQKQRRRWKPIYMLSPSKEELVQAAHKQVEAFKKSALLEHGVDFEIDPQVVEKLLDINSYQFEMGYTYVRDQLQDRLFKYLANHYHERGKIIKVSTEDTKIEINEEKVPGVNLILEGLEKPLKYNLGAVSHKGRNPWGDNAGMMRRINNFAALMRTRLKGNAQQIMDMKEMLKAKSRDWNKKLVITQIGTSGNGKTEFGKAMAAELYGDENAWFAISGINERYDLSRYVRPPTGIQGGKEETDFEKWFKARENAGGGVIILDELLSFSGLDAHQIAKKVDAINALYDMLDEQKITFGNKTKDARAFTFVITGNAMQEYFRGIGDDPDSERVAEKVRQKVSDRAVILDYFQRIGIDAPKLARFGKIYVNGPLPRARTMEIGNMMVARMKKKIKGLIGEHAEIHVDDKIVKSVVEQLSTNELGMREVNRGFDKLILEPMTGISQGFRGISGISATLEPDGHVKWTVNGKEVVLQGVVIDDDGLSENNWVYKADYEKNKKDGMTVNDLTPQMNHLDIPKKLKYTQETLEAVATHEVYGHWMVRALLDRTNKADAISLYAGRNYLGYVRDKEDELYQIDSLNKMLKEAIMLQAGHRAVFHKGKFATGGGGSGYDKPNGDRTDDIGRINKIIARMIANKLIPGISENSNPGQKAATTTLLDRLVELATDQIVKEGIESGKFDPVYQHVVHERFASGEELDKMAKGIDFSGFGSPDEYFLKKLTEAAQKLLGPAEEAKRNPRELQIVSAILARAYTEAEATNRGDRMQVAAIEKIRREGFRSLGIPEGQTVDPISGTCDYFKTLGRKMRRREAKG